MFWRSMAHEDLEGGDLVWLIEVPRQQGYHKLVVVTDTVEASDGVSESSKNRQSFHETSNKARSCATKDDRCFRDG